MHFQSFLDLLVFFVLLYDETLTDILPVIAIMVCTGIGTVCSVNGKA